MRGVREAGMEVEGERAGGRVGEERKIKEHTNSYYQMCD